MRKLAALLLLIVGLAFTAPTFAQEDSSADQPKPTESEGEGGGEG